MQLFIHNHTKMEKGHLNGKFLFKGSLNVFYSRLGLAGEPSRDPVPDNADIQDINYMVVCKGGGKERKAHRGLV